MKQQTFFVHANLAPIIDIDSECGTVYIRFSKAKIHKTMEQLNDEMIITVDLDKAGSVVGVEVIGCTEIIISELLAKAHIQAKDVDFSKAMIRTISQKLSMLDHLNGLLSEDELK